jgi:serine/threonine-protein kinase NIM1
MEYAPYGELYTRISEHGKISEPESKLIFSQVVSAVEHMHQHNIVHRDLKAENIFFANVDPIIVKIGDFGFSIEAQTNEQLDTYCGSPPYAAPE